MILHQFEVSPYCDKVRRILHSKLCIRGAEEGALMVAERPLLAAWMERVERATAGPR